MENQTDGRTGNGRTDKLIPVYPPYYYTWSYNTCNILDIIEFILRMPDRIRVFNYVFRYFHAHEWTYRIVNIIGRFGMLDEIYNSVSYCVKKLNKFLCKIPVKWSLENIMRYKRSAKCFVGGSISRTLIS
jgi:hypothetical protein